MDKCLPKIVSADIRWIILTETMILLTLESVNICKLEQSLIM